MILQADADAAQADADANAATLAGLPEILFATIASDGSVYETSFGLDSSVRNGVGDYTLTFNRDVFECAATTADLIFVSTRDVTADPTFGGTGEVDVRVTNETDSAACRTGVQMHSTSSNSARAAELKRLRRELLRHIVQNEAQRRDERAVAVK